VFWFRTDRDAPRRRIVAIDTARPEYEHWQELVPEAAETMESAGVVGDRFIAVYLRDAQSAVKVYELSGKFAAEMELPGIGAASGFTGRRKDSEAFFSFMTFTTPPTSYRYDVPKGETSVFRELDLKFRPDNFETKQVFYSSKDGTRVPMFLTYKKGTKPDGDIPTLLYGYGGFNIPMTPRFYVHNIVWLEQGGMYAVANLRGGGEYGREWHDGGRLKNKQNVFDDFISAAQWLVDNNYTRRERLAIHGRSNGGLLVGAAITQRPDLFLAAVPGVGVMDMLRFHKFTIGWAWVSDYGSPDEAEDFEVLRKYSPLHNIKPGEKYPATFITTADHDDRVVPAHSFKFAAALQAAQGGDEPILIRIETSAGHGAGTPVSKQIEEAADVLAFLMRELEMDWRTP
jgi:prolyl oligopeptidase